MPVDYLCSFSHPQHDYVAAGLDCKLVDPDGGVHVHRLQAQKSQVVPHTLPSDANPGKLGMREQMMKTTPVSSARSCAVTVKVVLATLLFQALFFASECFYLAT